MSFEDIKGQDSALGVLRESLRKGRIFSNYLFIGPDGVGKALAAKNFAKAINCRNRNSEEPCSECLSCKKVDSGSHPDISFVRPGGASSSIGVDEIRSVTLRANLKPYESKKKVFVINDAHTMNIASSNAFLKTLEEPPKDTVFILISPSEKAMLPTIVSRCHIVKFSTAPTRLVQRILQDTLGISENEAGLLSNFSSGRIGEAIKMKERKTIDRKNTLIDAMMDTGKDLREELGRYSKREGLKEDLEFFVSYFRDISVHKASRGNAYIFNIDRKDEIREQSSAFTQDELERLIRKIITLRSYVDYNVNPKMIIDVLVNGIRR
ncbi:MAG: DNA polymerase III subunit delta' [Omnitrophica bacterium]|nr:DNA polymerase III subunit delta' [Candidatus Omnitrophota bacterium]